MTRLQLPPSPTTATTVKRAIQQFALALSDEMLDFMSERPLWTRSDLHERLGRGTLSHLMQALDFLQEEGRIIVASEQTARIQLFALATHQLPEPESGQPTAHSEQIRRWLQGRSGETVAGLTRALNLSAAEVTQALATLHACGHLAFKQKGQLRIFRLNPWSTP